MGNYERYSRAQAEVIVATTFVACASVGLAVDGERVPYCAAWGEDGALEAVIEFAETIDQIARRIERALSRVTDVGSDGDSLEARAPSILSAR